MSNELIVATENFLSKISNLDGISADIIAKVIVPTIRTYQDKVNVGIQDSVSDLLDTFKQRIVETIFQTSSQWKLPKRELLLFPKNCRFCYQKGESTVFVIEQEPQMRTLYFKQDMLGTDFDYDYDELDDSERLPLALPYVIFVMYFKNNVLNYVYSCWRTQSLKSLDDMLYYPLLPNVHANLSVCMASMPARQTMTFLEKIDCALNDYWASQFNSDLADRWWSKHQRHDKLATGKTWSEASLENPLFILEANLQSAKTLKEFLETITKHEEEIDENILLHSLTERIDDTTKLLFNKILTYLKKTSFERYHPKAINEQLAVVMKEANAELAHFSFVLENELKLLRQSLEKTQSDKELICGPAWTDYNS